MSPRLKFAVCLAVGLHGVLVLSGQYHLSYDGYNHMFFADHYLKNWWSLWDLRWYAGFEVISYPPLVHQVIALLAGLGGVDAAYGLVLWVTASAYPLAVYRFSRIFTSVRAAENAALGAALLASVFLAAHIFGQLPTLAASLLALFAAAVFYESLVEASAIKGALAVALIASVIAAHHATLLFLPGLFGAVFLRAFSQPRLRSGSLLLRAGLLAAAATLLSLIVIWPFWDWGRSQTIQTPIDHLTRHNFFADPFAFVIFFLPEYGLLFPAIPAALWVARRKRLAGLGLAFGVYFLLGLGGTTPLPALIFGANWAWLTYDRFAFWASLLLLPTFGILISRLDSSWKTAGLWASMAVTAIVIGLFSSILTTQPRQIDLRPVVEFLSQDNRSSYRYLTFGMGDQMAYLSRLTPATTIDGSYHTARTLPFLRASGLAQIDTAFWMADGMKNIVPVLQKSGQYGVRWGFVNLKDYEPLLLTQGWHYLTTLSNQVRVWEQPDAVLPEPIAQPAEEPFKQFSWGVFPLLILTVSGLLTLKIYQPAASTKIFQAVQAVAVCLLPTAFTFWYYRPLASNPHPRVYFTYSDALIFLSDGLAAIILLIELIKSGITWPKISFKLSWDINVCLLAFCAFATLSTIWSLDWRTSLYVSLHLWLCYFFFRFLSKTPLAWRWFAIGCGGALVIQVWLGIWQFAAQTTAMTLPLGLNWPGSLVPAQSGASVVMLADGARWLRAYGLLPHPNVLGGFGLALSGCLLAWLLVPAQEQGGYTWPNFARIGPAFLLLLLSGTLILIGISFSRSAWVGLAVTALALALRWKKLDRKRLVLTAMTGLVTVTSLAAWLAPLLSTRVTANRVTTELVSNYTRIWLVERTTELIRTHPLLGSGVGTYTLDLAQHAAAFYDIEPVHNVILLITSELGAGGLLIFCGLAGAVAVTAFKSTHPLALVLASVVLGLFSISFFDHYFWTLAPGRLLMFTLLGLFAAQALPNKDQTDAARS